MAEKKKHDAPSRSKKATEGHPALSVDWHTPEGLVTRYANQMTVLFGPHECFVSFFEVVPPLFSGSQEEVEEQAKKLTNIRANCVSRVVVPNGFMPAFIQVLQSAWERHQGKSGSLNDAGEERKASGQ